MARIGVSLGAAVVLACAGSASGPEGGASLREAPSISTIVPDSFPPTTNLLPMTINGSGFPLGSTLDFVPAHGASFQSTSSRLIHVSNSQLVYKFNGNAAVGIWSVVVVTAEGRRSNPAGFMVR